MVTFDYHGRTGNNIFQYVFARLLASKNNLSLETPWLYDEFIKVTTAKQGEKIKVGNVSNIKDLYHDHHGIPWYDYNYNRCIVHCSGFFQDPKYYDPYRDEILTYFELPPVQERPKEHIVMHVRLTDYEDKKLRSVINPNWYGGLLRKMRVNPNKNKLFIVTDSPKHCYFNAFRYWQPEIVSNSPAEDFHFIRSFDKILCGNSSFSWWASWLSEAKTIYMFKKWMREPHGNIIPLAHTDRAKAIDGNWLN